MPSEERDRDAEREREEKIFMWLPSSSLKIDAHVARYFPLA